MNRLATKSIVIIGGTGGIGLTAATACLAAGANVVAVGRSDEAAERATKAFAEVEQDGIGKVVIGDACDSETSDRAVAAAVAAFGRLDGLYHVAGGSGRRFGDGLLHELTDEGINRTLQLNLASVLFSNRAAVLQFRKQDAVSASQHTKPRGGSVVNLSSVLAAHPSPQYFSTLTYAAAKAAIIGATRSAAACYAAQNIRFNVIAPGLVDTPMATRAVGNDEIMNFASRKQPLDGGRVGKPADTDGAAVFLLSDESSFITGQTIQVDGGWSVSEGR